MKNIDNKSIDTIICDLPYGQTKNQWDSVIPFDELWEQYERIIKDNGAIILFGQGMFTADLMQSNKKLWRYNLVWDKLLPAGFLNANRMPLRVHEDMVVFYKKPPIYNPQKVKGNKNHSKGKPKKNENNNYGDFEFVDNTNELGDMKHPKSILSFEKPHPSKALHPTQKPAGLYEWLIKTYSNEGDLILDNCCGSGTIGIAQSIGRNFIGIEKDEQYYKIACERIKNFIS